MPGREAIQEIVFQQTEPLTYEDLWGEPETESYTFKVRERLCPFLKIECSAWDSNYGCRAEVCIMERGKQWNTHLM
ncbi:MAG: hypothetical protein PHY02_06535 [Phycisphaerae bacterium]|nr:hypothetical protein [Phycisphaerae bacterium]